MELGLGLGVRKLYGGSSLNHEPETTAYLKNPDVNILDDGTVYFPSTPYEITGTEIWVALDLCVVSWKNSLGLPLKRDNLRTKFKFIYPRIGGTATAHRINLVDPSTFIGTFSGGWTHDGSGALPNGTNGYMATGCTYGTANFTPSNQSFGFCSKTNDNGLFADFGVIIGGQANVILYSRNSGNFVSRLDDTTNNSTSNADSLGLHTINRLASGTYKQYKDGSSIATITQARADLAPVPLEIIEAAVSNGGTPVQYSPRKRTLFYGGLGMTDGQVADLYNAWNTLEIALNR